MIEFVLNSFGPTIREKLTRIPKHEILYFSEGAIGGMSRQMLQKGSIYGYHLSIYGSSGADHIG